MDPFQDPLDVRPEIYWRLYLYIYITQFNRPGVPRVGGELKAPKMRTCDCIGVYAMNYIVAMFAELK